MTQMNLSPLLAYLTALNPTEINFTNTLLHGDFYAKHLIIDSNRKLCGVIDWGDTHVGNPALDLQIVHCFFPPDSHQVFLQNYGKVSEAIWRLAFFRGIYSTATIGAYAHDKSDIFLLKECEVSLQFLLANPLLKGM